MPSLFLSFFFYFFWKAAQCVPGEALTRRFGEMLNGGPDASQSCRRRRRRLNLHVRPAEPLWQKRTQVCCPACRTWSGGCRITPHLTPKQSREGEGCGRGKGFGRWGCIFRRLYTYLVQICLAFVRFVQVWKPLWSFPVILSEGCWVCYEIHPDRRPFRKNSFSHLKENVLVWAAKITKLLF